MEAPTERTTECHNTMIEEEKSPVVITSSNSFKKKRNFFKQIGAQLSMYHLGH